ncbi:alanyl-tRNA synthetase [Proteiniborus ethanoligenes]|uniref:Alanyl-tRNA synthetase n=1 Tax=Proteiniborus ethanoligenes TaxID=415015 RepID=A0A1H3RS36_9FIRM|nr:DHHA1 domain-containing protein [Proteiniborus ethanoligenes]TAH63434.1 MAG: metal-dependent hydrolase [Gottschalkiaceae bacterium]SDZ28584.1 alanyl-tRNA synthetase [Proteiniborus ethanoligenes]
MTEKIYLENPYLKELTAKVVNKEYSNSKFYITLNRTIIYPHLSGGQPMDKATINDIKVIDVYEEDDKIIHVLSDNINSNSVSLSIDWDTRFDHMQQHSGQHILSAVFYKLYNATTLSMHIGREYVYIDVSLPLLTEDDIKKIERFANEIIYSNFPIKTYKVENNDISSIPLRKPPRVDRNIRVVEIENVDYSPCAGTHLRNTGEVGIIKIRKWERYKGNIRIEFVCGNRALKDYSLKNLHINSISALLSAKDIDTYNAVEKLYNDYKLLEKQLLDTKTELLTHQINDFLKESYTKNNIRIVHRILYDFDPKMARYAMSQILALENTICILCVVENNNKCQILMGRSPNINIDVKEIFNSVIHLLDGKGGGNAELAQGGGTNIDNIPVFMEKSLEILDGLI